MRSQCFTPTRDDIVLQMLKRIKVEFDLLEHKIRTFQFIKFVFGSSVPHNILDYLKYELVIR